MIGIIPVGGKGERIGLPFPKELLPIPKEDKYIPIIDFTVKNMEKAGCDKIIFVHGKNFKVGLLEMYEEKNYIHIRQKEESFGGTLVDAGEWIKNSILLYKWGEIILFGLPDTIYEENIFLKMKIYTGTVVGCFKDKTDLKVDRWIPELNLFKEKSTYEETKSELFWGVIKFDYESFIKIVDSIEKHKCKEIGRFLKPHNLVISDCKYYDVGTWKNYYSYLREVLLDKEK